MNNDIPQAHARELPLRFRPFHLPIHLSPLFSDFPKLERQVDSRQGMLRIQLSGDAEEGVEH